MNRTAARSPSLVVYPHSGTSDDLEAFQDLFEEQELRSRAARASHREVRREHHLAKQNAAPSLGSLIAPGVPFGLSLVLGDKRLVWGSGAVI